VTFTFAVDGAVCVIFLDFVHEAESCDFCFSSKTKLVWSLFTAIG